LKLVVGCDKNAVYLKNHIKNYLLDKGYEVKDIGVKSTEEETYYPQIAKRLVETILDKRNSIEEGILICGTGIGMALTANKFPGIRAAKCHDIYSAERAKKSNNSNIMTMGAQIISTKLAEKLVDEWVNSEFTGGRSKPKVELIDEYEKENIQ